MLLIPLSPGGSKENAPCYVLQDLPPARFDVLLDDELLGDPVAYYRGRARLAAATYHVLVYDSRSYQPLWQGKASQPIAVLGPDAQGQFRLDQAELEEGQEYLWLATAEADDGRGPMVLWSVPQYFKVLPQPDLLPSQIGDSATPLRQLLVLQAQQERARAALAGALRGLAPYYNFAAASDSFICAALTEDGPTPCPDTEDEAHLTFTALLAIGDVAAQGLACQGPVAPRVEVQKLGSAVRTLAQTLSTQGITAGVGALSESGDRLGSADEGDSTSALSQLMIALDSTLGTGTRTALKTSLDSFPAYAKSTAHRIEALQEYAGQIQGTLGPQQWQLWESYLRQVRGELALMTEDVERGRTNLGQLQQQIAAAAQIAHPLYPREWRFVAPDGTLDQTRIARIGPDETEQRRRLAEEIYWYHLQQFSEVLLPQVQP